MKMIHIIKLGQILKIIFLSHKFNIGSNKSFSSISKFDALLSTLYVQCYLVNVDIFLLSA
jgi:hypothetical protein